MTDDPLLHPEKNELAAFALGKLESDEATRIETHLGECKACCETLLDLKDEFGLSYLFVAHDLSVVRHISDHVAVMYLGRIVEFASRDSLFERPTHPYTQALLSAVPEPDPVVEKVRERIILEGDVPSPADPPSGCVFRTRCWKAQEVCEGEVPELTDRGQGHPVACYFPQTEFAREIPKESRNLEAAEFRPPQSDDGGKPEASGAAEDADPGGDEST